MVLVMTSLCFYKGTFKLITMNISEDNIIHKASEYQASREAYYKRIKTDAGDNLTLSKTSLDNAWLMKKIAELELRIKTLEDESKADKTKGSGI